MTIPLPTATADQNAEGADFTFASGNAGQPAETRNINYTQIFVRPFSVSGTIEVVGKYGRGSEFSMRKLHAMKALKINVEWALLNNTASAAGSSGVARTLNGILGVISTNTATAADSSTTDNPIDEPMLNKLLQTVWEAATTAPDTLVCGGFVKRGISGFRGSTSATPIVHQDGSQVAVSSIDVYKNMHILNSSICGELLICLN